MKLLLTISFILTYLFSFGQVTYKWRYYTKSSGTTYDGYYSVAMPSDSLTNPTKRPLIVFYPGAGETGASNLTEAKAVLHGTSRDLKMGLWNGGIKQSNGYTDSIVYPIYVVVQTNDPDGSVPSIPLQRDIFNAFLADYNTYINYDEIHLAGLSIGGRNALFALVNSGSSPNTVTYATQFASAFLASAGGRSASITDNAANIGSWAVKGGRLAYSTGADDVVSPRYDTATIIKMVNDSVPGSGVGFTWRYADGFTDQGHGGWDTLWRYNRHWNFIGGLTPFEWHLKHTKAPKAVAQTIINTTSDNVTLNGVSNGWYKTVAWSTSSGATISNASSDTTGVYNIPVGTTTYTLTVTNTNDARTATHTVTVNRTAVSTEAEFIKTRGRELKVITE